MRRLRPLVIGIFLLAVAAVVSHARQGAELEIPYFDMQAELSESVQQELERAWSVYSENLAAPEYAYCITEYVVVATADSMPVLHVLEIERATPESSSPVSINYSCGFFPAIHSHPPTDCEIGRDGTWVCVSAAKESMDELCDPSPTDVRSAVEDWHRIHGVQCGPRRVHFFTPDIFTE